MCWTSRNGKRDLSAGRWYSWWQGSISAWVCTGSLDVGEAWEVSMAVINFGWPLVAFTVGFGLFMSALREMR